jgi:hypothetical protein
MTLVTACACMCLVVCYCLLLWFCLTKSTSFLTLSEIMTSISNPFIFTVNMCWKKVKRCNETKKYLHWTCGMKAPLLWTNRHYCRFYPGTADALKFSSSEVYSDDKADLYSKFIHYSLLLFLVLCWHAFYSCLGSFQRPNPRRFLAFSRGH